MDVSQVTDLQIVKSTNLFSVNWCEPGHRFVDLQIYKSVQCNMMWARQQIADLQIYKSTAYDSDISYVRWQGERGSEIHL